MFAWDMEFTSFSGVIKPCALCNANGCNLFVCITTTLAFIPWIKIAYMYKSIGLLPLVILQLHYLTTFAFSVEPALLKLITTSTFTHSWLKYIFGPLPKYVLYCTNMSSWLSHTTTNSAMALSLSYIEADTILLNEGFSLWAFPLRW